MQVVLRLLIVVVLLVPSLAAAARRVLTPDQARQAAFETCQRTVLGEVCGAAKSEECALLSGVAAEFCAHAGLAQRVRIAVGIMPGNIENGARQKEVAIVVSAGGQTQTYKVAWRPNSRREFQLETWGRAIMHSIADQAPRCAPVSP